MRRRRTPVVAAVVVLLVAAAAVVWWWLHRDEEKRREAQRPAPQVQVATVPVREQDVPIFRAGVGTVQAMQSVTVKARVDGQLERVFFREGQDVRAGEALAQLDPRTFQAQLEQVQAQKARDQAQLGNARADLKRYSDLIAQDAATQQQVDTQKALVAQLQAAVGTDDAQIHYAQVQLGYTRIAAPIPGRTGARLVDPGNIVHAADATGLVVINQIDPISVVFTLPEEAFAAVNDALHASTGPLQVVVYARESGQPLATGRLTLLNNQIDTSTGTFQLKAAFANAAHALWPGEYVNVRLILRREPAAHTVPAVAVQRSQDGTFVWVVGADGKAHNRPIKLGPVDDNVAVVDSGVQPGERVVVDGQYKVRDGVAVTEIARAAGSAASGAASAASGARP